MSRDRVTVILSALRGALIEVVEIIESEVKDTGYVTQLRRIERELRMLEI